MKVSDRKPILVVHGGAWAIPEHEVETHQEGIQKALEKGWSVFRNGGTVIDVVEEAVVVMENDPIFDAGKGSILNTDGSIEMDASIMDGCSFDAGAVAAIRNFPNPIRIARCVMEKTEHILLAGRGCEAFAKKEGFQSVPIEELLTERELQRLNLLIKDKQYIAPHSFGRKRGTVGAVAMDSNGNLAAATSTGGTPKKIPGRVGDTPIIGCGTYAENGLCGVSCTGWGESIMKVMLAREVAERIRSGLSALIAAQEAVNLMKTRCDGLGGVICLDFKGDIGIFFNTPKMARGYIFEGMDQPFVGVV